MRSGFKPGRAASCCTIGILVAAACSAAPAAAQQTGTIQGRVISAEGLAALAGVYVAVEGGNFGAVTDERGAYRLTRLPAGDLVLVARYLGRRVGRLEVRLEAGPVTHADFALAVEAVPVTELVVSAAREAQRQAETPASIGVVAGETLREARPAHPSEVLNRVPGVWVNATAGEGHMTAIRHPKTTNPVYLFAEDGVPTRSTGFFNHNALYEVDLPQAERVEVIKGPTSALYGSDAIGGVINVVTRAPGSGSGTSATIEGGAWGFGRVLASVDHAGERDGLRAELNVTRTDGWRDGTAYDRQTGTLRWDRRLGRGSLRTVVAFSRIDQGTAGSSSISRDASSTS